jgi:hypothetical protein
LHTQFVAEIFREGNLQPRASPAARLVISAATIILRA